MCATDCVLVGLDWAEPMMLFILHVTCSCIPMHTFFPFNISWYIWIVFGTFLIVFLSPSLFCLRYSVSMTPKFKSTPSLNPLCSAASTSSNLIPSSIWFHDEDAWKAFLENFSRWGIHSKCQVILADFVDTDLRIVIHIGVGSHCVTSRSHVHPCWFRSFTPTCMDLIF